MQQIDWLSCRSEQMSSEQRIIEKWVKEYQDSLGGIDLKILEIGSDEGQSTALLAQFGEVFAIDLWSEESLHGRDYDTIGSRFYKFQQNMNRLRIVDRVFPICNTSKALSFMGFMDFGVVYIDGGHSYEAVKQDIEESRKHLTHSGIMIFDDLAQPGDPDPWEGVARAIYELIDEGEFRMVEHIRAKACLRRKNA